MMCQSLGHHSPSSFTSFFQSWWQRPKDLVKLLGSRQQSGHIQVPRHQLLATWNLQLNKPKPSSLSSIQPPPHFPQSQSSFPLHPPTGSLPKFPISATAPSIPSQAGTKPLIRLLHLQSVTKPILFFLPMAFKSIPSTPFPQFPSSLQIHKEAVRPLLAASPIPGSPYFPVLRMSLPEQISLTNHISVTL